MGQIVERQTQPFLSPVVSSAFGFRHNKDSWRRWRSISTWSKTIKYECKTPKTFLTLYRARGFLDLFQGAICLLINGITQIVRHVRNWKGDVLAFDKTEKLADLPNRRGNGEPANRTHGHSAASFSQSFSKAAVRLGLHLESVTWPSGGFYPCS